MVLFVAIRYGQRLSRFAAHQSDEVILLSVLGAVLLVAGLMQRLQVSAAIGAFLVGTAISGPIAEQSHRLLAPLRDLFAATFFFFFGLEIDPASLLPVLPAAIALGLCTALTKIGAGYWAARRKASTPRALAGGRRSGRARRVLDCDRRLGSRLRTPARPLRRRLCAAVGHRRTHSFARYKIALAENHHGRLESAIADLADHLFSVVGSGTRVAFYESVKGRQP